MAGDGARDGRVTVNGLELHYREWGAAGAPPVLILHGLTGHAREFDRVAGALADVYHVYAIDQRGHGESAWAAAYSPQLMAEDAAALIDTLGIGPARVIGHSMGGVNSWWLAATHQEQVERLVCVDITPATITSPELVDGWMAALEADAQAEYAEPEDAVREFVTEYGGPYEEELRAFVRHNLHQSGEGRWGWRFDSKGLRSWVASASADEAAHIDALRRLQCPVLVLLAGDSQFTTAADGARMLNTLPGAQLRVIAGSGHDIHIDQFGALLEELRAFLSHARG